MTIAFWCVFVAVLMPYVCFGIARNRARPLRDNRDPRDFPNRIQGIAKRAWSAHLNAFETLPGFAAAVIIAHLAGTPQHLADGWALAWVAARLLFIGCYLGDKPGLRSAAHVASMMCVLGLFVSAAVAGRAGV